MSLVRIRAIAIAALLLPFIGCGQGSQAGLAGVSPAAPSRLLNSTGGTVSEALSGPAIGSVVPEGQAQADESQFASGGSTILTVAVKKVNLPDGTVLGVSLDFSPVGLITLNRGEGTLSTDLGHFGVSNDQVRVTSGGTTILSGAFFK